MSSQLNCPNLAGSKYKNWIKAGLGVLYTKKGIEPFVYDEIEQFQQKCLKDIRINNGLPSGTVCSSCSTENVIVCSTKNKICVVVRGTCTFHRNSATQYLSSGCPNKVCHNFKNEIQKAHRYNGPSYKNTNAKQWCSNPWEVAKCFMPLDGYKDVTSAAETDFNGIISVIINYKAFELNVNDDISKKKNIFEKGREIGKAVRHSPQLKIEDTDLQQYFTDLQNLLSDLAFSTSTAAQDAKKKLLQLQNDTLVIGKDDVRNVLDDVAKAVQDKVSKEISEAEKKKMDLITITRKSITDIEEKGKVSIGQLNKALTSAKEKLEEQLQVKAVSGVKQIEESAASGAKKISEKTDEALKKIGESIIHSNKGKGIKPSKTDDPQLTIMRRRFCDTMRHRLPSDTPTAFVELSYIKQKLREDHFVVVCGNSSSLYLQAALTAVKCMVYAEDRCFELSTASDWWHVTFEEADCIVVVNPFGKNAFDHQKASAMSDIFDSMLSATKDERYRDFRFRDIVLISKKDVLNECVKHFDHKLLISKITILDNSHTLASKGRYSVSPSSAIGEADTYDNVVTKKWTFKKELNAKFDSEGSCFITGMCIVPHNKLAMTDQNNKSLKLVNISDGRITDRITFSTEPKCPTLLPQERLAVLLHKESIIQLFSIHTGLNTENATRLNCSCSSIIFENNVFFAFSCYPAVIKTLNMHGEELSTTELESDIQGMDIDPIHTDICPDKTSFYISNWAKILLLRVNREGQMMTMYKDNGLNDPEGILAMADGSVYVCDKNNSSVLQMRADFTRSRVVLGLLDNVAFPATLCYWIEENIMFVSSASNSPTHSNNLKLFSLTT